MEAIQTYLDQVSSFNRLSIDQVNQLLAGQEDFVLYLGRHTCPFCRKFVHTLKGLEKTGVTINYLHSTEPQEDLDKIQVFRNDYHLPTVPSFIVRRSGQVITRSDSSLSLQALKELVHG